MRTRTSSLLLLGLFTACGGGDKKPPGPTVVVDLARLDAVLAVRQAEILAAQAATTAGAFLDVDPLLRDSRAVLAGARTRLRDLVPCARLADVSDGRVLTAELAHPCAAGEALLHGSLHLAAEVSNPGDQIFRGDTKPGEPFFIGGVEAALSMTLYRSTDGTQVSVDIDQSARLGPSASALKARARLLAEPGGLRLDGEGVYLDRHGEAALVISGLEIPIGRRLPSRGAISYTAPDGEVRVEFRAEGEETAVSVTTTSGTEELRASELFEMTGDPDLDPVGPHEAFKDPGPIDVRGSDGLYPGEQALTAPPAPADNPQTPEKVALGRLLFFDPILSGDQDTACASCHDPKYGFSDGLPTSVGHGATGFGPGRAGGPVLGRAAPTIWNAAYYDRLFWDGRAASLEEQALGPMTARDEMRGLNVAGCGDAPGNCAAAMDTYIERLRGLPEYVTRFAAVFPGDAAPAAADAITAANIAKAIAAFERTVTSRISPYDRFVGGDAGAMTAGAKRGRVLFFEALRCQSCHAAPLFSDQEFARLALSKAQTGAPDPGRAAITGRLEDLGKFKTVSLRNAALTGPWMHDGAVVGDTIEPAIHVYHTAGAEMVNEYPLPRDRRMTLFSLDEGEHLDLIEFLEALTDTSAQPSRPAAVPSGLTPGGDPNP